MNVALSFDYVDNNIYSLTIEMEATIYKKLLLFRQYHVHYETLY